MPRGGARPNTGGARTGAGRKAKVHEKLKPPTENRPLPDPKSPNAEVQTRIDSLFSAGQLTPLEWLVSAYLDPNSGDMEFRRRCADSAAPYIHRKRPQAVEVDGQLSLPSVIRVVTPLTDAERIVEPVSVEALPAGGPNAG